MKIEVFLEKYTEEFGLLLVAGKDGIDNEILFSAMECPGLILAGYLTGGVSKKDLNFWGIRYWVFKNTRFKALFKSIARFANG